MPSFPFHRSLLSVIREKSGDCARWTIILLMVIALAAIPARADSLTFDMQAGTAAYTSSTGMNNLYYTYCNGINAGSGYCQDQLSGDLLPCSSNCPTDPLNYPRYAIIGEASDATGGSPDAYYLDHGDEWFRILRPDGSTVGMMLAGVYRNNGSNPQGLQVMFGWTINGSAYPAGSHDVFAGNMVENGAVQTLFSVTYADGRVDTINFQDSSAAATPEPATVWLAVIATTLAFLSRATRRLLRAYRHVATALVGRRPTTFLRCAALPATALLLLTGFLQVARADSLTFDAQASTVTHDGTGNYYNGGCTPQFNSSGVLVDEYCRAQLDPDVDCGSVCQPYTGPWYLDPNTYSVIASSSPNIQNSPYTTTVFDILDPGGAYVGQARVGIFSCCLSSGNGPDVTLIWAPSGGTLQGGTGAGRTDYFAGYLTENGSLQTFLTVTYSDARVDTIYFRGPTSFASTTPEPATTWLLAFGILTVILRTCRLSVTAHLRHFAALKPHRARVPPI